MPARIFPGGGDESFAVDFDHGFFRPTARSATTSRRSQRTRMIGAFHGEKAARKGIARIQGPP
jgi:hypothetical protein